MYKQISDVLCAMHSFAIHSNAFNRKSAGGGLTISSDASVFCASAALVVFAASFLFRSDMNFTRAQFSAFQDWRTWPHRRQAHHIRTRKTLRRAASQQKQVGAFPDARCRR